MFTYTVFASTTLSGPVASHVSLQRAKEILDLLKACAAVEWVCIVRHTDGYAIISHCWQRDK